MYRDFFLKNLKDNWKSGFAVSLVSIPLAVSLAVASHATPIMGVITAIWAGLIASIFGGSNYNIIGPTGALSGILATYAIANGTGVLPTLAIMSGLIIFAAYIFKLEKYLAFVPSSTIHGFVLGVAFIIILNQINFAIGLSNLPVHESFVQNILESIRHISAGSSATFLLFLIFSIMLFVLIRIAPNIPGAIIVSPIGILIGYLSTQKIIPVELQTLQTKFANLQPKLFELTNFVFSPKLIIPAMTVALISMLETMISARIADGMTKTKHNKNKELLGLGLANIACGLTGGIPATAALARTTLNIKSGCTSKISSGINSVFIILISFMFLKYFKFMPLAVVAAILTVVGIKMIETEHFVKMFKIDKTNFILALVVAFITVLEDPIIGILLGASISMLIFMQKLSKGQYELTEHPQVAIQIQQPTTQNTPNQTSTTPNAINTPVHDTLVYAINGEFAYINAQAHVTRFEKQMPVHKNIIINLKALHFMDQDGVDAFEEILELLHNNKKTVAVVVTNQMISKMLEESTKFNLLKQHGLVFDNLQKAATAIKAVAPVSS
jgi:SulP family sulfate permease